MRWFIKNPHAIWRLVLIGLLIRLPFIPLIGFKQDFLFLVSWAEYLVKSSPVAIYADFNLLSVKFVNYPPVYLYILTLLARVFRSLCAAPFESTAFLVLIKSVTIAFEGLTGFVLYHWASKRWDERTGLWAFGLYFLNPAILYVSSYYGQLDAIFTAFLLLAIVGIVEDKAFWGGCALSAALLIKIQTLPFIPLFFGFLLLQKRMKSFFLFGLGFALTGALIVSPYIIHNQLAALMQECVIRSFQWGKFVSVGAFNLWYLHADPGTFDGRIWGLFFNQDGALRANALFNLLTYKNLGTALFGCAFLATLYAYWKRDTPDKSWIAAMHVALAFFMLPTKVHERYLFPYFVFAAPLAASNRVRRCFFFAFSLTYLINLMVVCPLFGQSVDVRELDSSIGVLIAFANVMLYAFFIAYEYGLPFPLKRRWAIAAKTLAMAFFCGVAVLFWRSSVRQTDPNVLYLSNLAPISVEQSWPLLPPELANKPRSGYGQLQADLSTDGRQIQIGDTIYRYGLGAHAISRVEYNVPGKYQWFECLVGVDAEALAKYRETPSVATVTFTVWVNGQHILVTPLTIPTTPPRLISIPLTEKAKGFNRIQLVVDGTADGVDSDHADWALARVFRLTP
jgi:Gpi18-like mannosyltransferase